MTRTPEPRLVADVDGAAAADAVGGVVVTTDVSVPAQVDAMVRVCTQSFGGLDIAVNNAGIAGAKEGRQALAAGHPAADWARLTRWPSSWRGWRRTRRRSPREASTRPTADGWGADTADMQRAPPERGLRHCMPRL